MELKTNHGKLNFLYTNTCSLRNKLVELESLLDDVDIAAITETWLTPLHGDGLLPNGFVSYRCDRLDGHGGGCLLLVKEVLGQRPITGLFQSPCVQMVGCVLESDYPLALLCVYRSPAATAEECTSMLHSIKHSVSGVDHCVVVGDFNAPSIDWIDEVVDFNHMFSGELLDAAHEMALHQLIRSPTRYRGDQKPSILDLVPCRYSNDIGSVRICPPIGKSDHVVVRFQLNSKPTKPLVRLGRSLGNVHPEAVLRQASETQWLPAPGLSMEDKWLFLKRIILGITDTHAPNRIRRIKKRKPWFTHGVRRALLHRNKAWARYSASGGHSKFLIYKRLRNRAVKVIREAKERFELRLAVGAQTNPKRYFQYVQSRTKTRKEITRFLLVDGRRVDSDAAIADAFRSYFASVYRTDSGIPIPPLGANSPGMMPEVSIEPKEVHSVLLSLDHNKTERASSGSIETSGIIPGLMVPRGGMGIPESVP